MTKLLDSIVMSEHFANGVFCVIVLICIYAALRFLTIWGDAHSYEEELWPADPDAVPVPLVDIVDYNTAHPVTIDTHKFVPTDMLDVTPKV